MGSPACLAHAPEGGRPEPQSGGLRAMEIIKGCVPGGVGPPALSDRELPSSLVGQWRDSVCPGVPPCKVTW